MCLMVYYNSATAEIPSESQVASVTSTTLKLPPNTKLDTSSNCCNTSNLEAGRKASQKACCQQHPPVLLNQHPGQSKHDANIVAG